MLVYFNIFSVKSFSKNLDNLFSNGHIIYYCNKSLYKIKSILRCRWIFFLLLKRSLFVFYYYPALILWLVVIYKWHIILKHWTGQSILSSNGWALKNHWIVTHHSFVESYTMFLWKHHPLSSFFYLFI